MQKIVITGANGMVGQNLVQILLKKGYTVVALGKGDQRFKVQSDQFSYYSADLTHPFEVQSILAKEQPDCIVHCAAMTQVDDCELNQKEAHALNVEATARLLLDAEAYSKFFVFLSTDFVFDGETGLYSETDPVKPISWYGQTKVEAEAIVETAEIPWAIIRTCLVYGLPVEAGRQNLFSWVKSSLETGKAIKVVDDQWRTPTWVQDLVNGIVLVIEQKATGIWHLSGEDLLTPYQMAHAIAEKFNLDKSLIERVTANNFSQPGKRPARTGFTIEKAKTRLGYAPGDFRNNLDRLKG
ncbi:SDR family oxidoreductase [Flavihumibacter profundi]|uniref:SDR family oxidoreductase n=1 Tax=Flavihumibacter profundi TaxID=2716883 RepID=UPI001CC726DA|nr:SDR family oxidoreductase [Flavihumibacter profundi]MBZ5856379.1 SDR family oxidoreductase [Flavihumibacter profundi]